MMPRVYAGKPGRSSAVLIGALLALLLGSACGSPARRSSTGPSKAILALNEKAEAAERRREHLKAQAYLQQAVDQAQDPTSAAYANRQMASLLLFWHQQEQALPYLEKSVEHDPTQIPVWNDLGVVYSNLQQPAKARGALERAVELGPKEPISRMGLAAELVRQSEFELARSHYQVLLTLKIPPRIENATHRALELLRKEIERTQK